MHFTRSLALIGLAALTANAQSLVRSVNGPGFNAQFGAACIEVPDQNNDGYADLLVGAPGYDQERGAIFCVSGAHLALGLGTSTLWSLAPGGSAGNRFGAALASIGDATGDGVGDFLVGQPGFDANGMQDCGAARVVNGATRALERSRIGPEQGCGFGSALAVCGDLNLDGRVEVAVGAPGPLSSFSYILMLDLNAVGAHGDLYIQKLWEVLLGGSFEAGAALASGFDLNGDGRFDVLMGEPGLLGRGGVRVLSGFNGATLANFTSSISGERFGASVDAAHDYDEDGLIDFVIGAPNSPAANGAQPGRAVVLSGQRLRDSTPPYEIYTLNPLAPGATPTTLRFGAAVRASRDLNGDGVGEILVGAPDYATTIPVGPGRGSVSLYSGATGVRLTSVVGSNNDRLGDSIAGAIGDLDGDGFEEFVVAGSRSDVVATDNGVLKAYRLFPVAPATYCTGKPNSLGCVPSVAFSGSPSESSGQPFLISATNVLNQKNGLLFYGYAPASVAFQGGFKCVANPNVRTPPQNSGGATSGSSCTGVYSFDFNAWITSSLDPGLVTGAEVYAQYWARDPQSPSKTSLSNALRLFVNP